MTGPAPQLATFWSLDQIDRAAWDRLANAGAPDFPFADYDYLHALEASQSVSAATGWKPHYLTVSVGGQLQGASYVYAKEHSYGEYIFDWAWAQAYDRHGVDYYPKLSAAVPFTPATGPKLLLGPGPERPYVARLLIEGARELLAAAGHSSLHYLFLTPEEVPYFQAQDFLIRHSFQYHWQNHDYASFDAFLDELIPKRRQQIVRERRQLAGEGLEVRVVSGQDLTPALAERFYGFYASTVAKRGGIAYLTPAFFTQVFATMSDRIFLIVADDRATGETEAGALYFTKGKSLFGRYWGACREVRNLHFELCYYQPIAWAIEHGIQLFEAGAQGEHKIARGLLPTVTLSAHQIVHPAFRDAIGHYVEEEKAEIATLFAELAGKSPYRT